MKRTFATLLIALSLLATPASAILPVPECFPCEDEEKEPPFDWACWWACLWASVNPASR